MMTAIPQDGAHRGRVFLSFDSFLAIAAACLFVPVGCGPTDKGAAGRIAELPNVDTSIMQPQVASALDDARQAVLANASSAEAWGRYGMLLDAHELADPATRCYQVAWQLDPTAFRWPYLLGTVLQARDVPAEEVIQAFEGAAAVNANYAPLHFRMGEVLSTRGRLEEAQESYERAIQLDDSLAVVHRSLGQTLSMLGELEAARAHLVRADALSPNDRSINASLAMVNRRIGRDDEAAMCMAAARTAPERVAIPDPVKFEVRQFNVSLERCRERALQAANEGNVNGAMTHLSPCASLQTDDPYFHFLLGLTYSQIGQHERAVAQMERTLSLDREFPGAAFQLGAANLALGRLAEAEMPLRMALALKPDHATARARMGTILQRTGRPTDAIVEFEQVADAAALDDVAEFDWANALAQTGAAQEAIAHYRRAIELNPSHADAYFNLGIMLSRTGEQNQAIECYRAAVKIDPNHRARERLGSPAASDAARQ